MTDETPAKKPLVKRPWIWVVAVIVVGYLLINVNMFPAGRYTCTWSGDRPSGALAGDLVVTVGSWPGTFPLKARIYTATGPVLVTDWSHVHSGYAREFNAVIPIGADRFQALCEL